MPRIKCLITGKTYDATESYTVATRLKKEWVDIIYEPITEEEWIEHHNKMAENPHPDTGLPKKWEDETAERKARLLQTRAMRRVISYREIYIDEPIQQFLNGYFVSSSKGGNMDRGWAKIFGVDSVEVIDA